VFAAPFGFAEFTKKWLTTKLKIFKMKPIMKEQDEFKGEGCHNCRHGRHGGYGLSEWRNRPPVSSMTTSCQELGCHSENFLQGKTSLPKRSSEWQKVMGVN
jgi:hypothetical protein